MPLETTNISALPNAALPLTGAERIPMDQNTVTVDATTQDIANLAVAVATLTVRVAVRNNSGAAIAKGTPVYVTGSSGVTVTVAAADASTEATAARTLGLMEAATNHNADGSVIAVGLLTGLNTSALTEGQVAWLSETTGALTTTRPTQPAHGVVIGYCIKQGSGTSGEIYVKVDNGLELGELHDVSLTGATAGQVLRLAADGLWKPATLAVADVADIETGSSAIYPTQGLTPAAARLLYPGSTFFSQDGTSAPVVRTYRSAHECLISGSILRIAWVNQSIIGTAANSYTLQANVMVADTQSSNLAILPAVSLTFEGAPTIAVAPGQVVISDPVILDFEVGQFLFVRQCVTSTAASNNWAIGPSLTSTQEGVATGNTLGSLTSYTGGQGVAPFFIGTQARSKSWISAIGDSILDGAGDGASAGVFHYWQRLTKIPGARISNPGERASVSVGYFPKRFQGTAGATHALSEHGTNDIGNGDSLATVQTSLIRQWRLHYKLLQSVSQATILPRAGSTDSWITASNQTISSASQETVRTSLNAWLRAGAPVTASATSPFYTPAAIGAAGSFPCPYLSRVLDWCSVIEVNSSNVLTADGGRWLVGDTLRQATATSGLAASILDTNANFFNITTPYGGTVAGCAARIISGTGAGQTRIITGAQSATQINMNSNWTTPPDSTSVYQIIDVPTSDGVHPSGNGHRRLARWLADNYSQL